MQDFTLRPGDILIAPPRMQDSRFAKTVIMLTHFRDGASFGLVLNKPSGHTINDLGPELDIPLPENPRLYWGGPVNPQTIWMLHSSDWMLDSSIRINQHWAMTSNTEMFHHISDGDTPQHWIITFGFCGWARHQLEAELKGEEPFSIESSWLYWSQPDDHLLDVAPEELWRVSTEQCSHQAVNSWMV
jgi:putative transcriptional regulator